MALNAYLTLKGAKQGEIKGGVTQKGREGTIAVLAVSYGVETPVDTASGMATGKRQHKPLTITKELDQASPLIFQALTTNETLTLAKIDFWRPAPDGSGTLAPYFTIALTNAFISSIEAASSGRTDLRELDTHELEELRFVYQKIEITWVEGGKSATDDWNAPI